MSDNLPMIGEICVEYSADGKRWTALGRGPVVDGRSRDDAERAPLAESILCVVAEPTESADQGDDRGYTLRALLVRAATER